MKELEVKLCDFKLKSLQQISPLKKKPFLFLKPNMEDSSCEKVRIKDEKMETEEMKEEGKKEVRKKIVKIIGVKSEEEEKEESESDKNNEESDAEEEKEDSESDKDEDSDAPDEAISSYEKMIEKKRAERMAFLKSLQIDEVKTGFQEAVSSVKKKKQPVKRKYIKRERTPPPQRKSSRIANLSISTDLSEDALFQKAINDAKKNEPFYQVPSKKRQYLDLSSTFSRIIKNSKTGIRVEMQEEENKYKEIPAELPFKTALQFEDLYEEFCKDFDIQASDTDFKLFSYNKSVIKNLTLQESNIAKVTPARITAVAWYPFPENLIFAAGDKYGNLGIWKVDSNSDPYVLKNHSEGTTSLMFNPFNVSCLVSSSYEGTLRSGDMVKHIFNEVYNVSDESCCTYCDVLSQTTYLVAQKNGQVALVDDRAEGKRSQKKHTCHDYCVKTVHVHPVNRNVFVTAENRGSIRLWDLRKLQKKPLADIKHHTRCVNSAYFSPVSGNSILATSMDDTISIFDSTALTEDIKLTRSLKHNNCTGRWLTVFRATWLTNSDEAFVVGSMNADRRIEMYDKDMGVYHILKHENLCTITSLNIFHPSRPALAGANSSGKVVVFTPK